MSFDNNNYTQNSSTDNQWNGSTWSDDSYDDGYQSFSNDSFETIDTTSVSSTLKSISRVNFEENVLAQSFVFMAIALAITAFSALYTTNSPSMIFFLYMQGGFYIFIIAELIVVFIAGAVARRNLIVPSAIFYTLYSVINGITISYIFFAYTDASIIATFFITAGMFGVLALYGIVTKKNLSSVGSLCLMALVGIILASVVNLIFLKSSAIDLVISIIGVLIFVGITAYDTQKIKNMMYMTNSENITCIALIGALELYLDFINIFLKLLRIFARSRD